MKNSLYLITNRKMTARPLVEVVEQALAGGVDLVQLREKDLPEEQVLELAWALRTVIDKYGRKLIINGHARAAAAVKADGVHLGYDAGTIREARKIIGPGGLIGVSVHSVQEGVAAWQDGADYLLVSHIFPTDCKAGVPPRGIKILAEIKQQTAGGIHLIALGGINHTNAARLLDHGFNNLAVMSVIMAADNPKEAARKIKNIMELKEDANF
jgi:thiamine-phosphate pyrophosphorylase